MFRSTKALQAEVSRLRSIRHHAAQALYFNFHAFDRPDYRLREFTVSHEPVERMHGFRWGRCDDRHRSQLDEKSHVTPAP
jgi:hypothetical protein